MFDSTEIIKQSVLEINADMESNAKSSIKSLIKEIVTQQGYIEESKKRIAEAQAKIKAITFDTVNVSSLGL